MDLAKNPMFREMARRERKVVIDDRFKRMLSDKRFEEFNTQMMDKRGRPLRRKGDDFLARIYEMKTADDDDENAAEEEEEDEDEEENDEKDDDEEADGEEMASDEEEQSGDDVEEEEGDEEEGEEDDEDELDNLQPIQLDLARGEAPMVSSSSEEEEEEEDDEEEEAEDEQEEDVEEDAETEAMDDAADGAKPQKRRRRDDDTWGEMDRGVARVEWASRRLAVCNMDWAKISAEDLMLILHSFKPPNGCIQSVSVYLSDFGANNLEEEKKYGPRLNLKPARKRHKGRTAEDEKADLEQRTKQAIRAYELDRLRYYYAVCECDTVETAATIYESCDGVEYGASGMRFDLRFIPDHMEFEEDNRLRDRITSHQLDLDRYKPKKHVESHPLVCSNPKMSWDQPDAERRQLMRNAFSAEANFEEFESLIGDISDEGEDNDNKEEQRRQRYELLIGAAREAAEKSAKRGKHDDDEEEDGGEKSPGANADADEEEENRNMEEVEEEEEEGSEKGMENRAENADQTIDMDQIGEEMEEEDDDDDEPWGVSRKPKEKKKTKFQLYLERKKRLKAERKSAEQDKRKARKQRHQRTAHSKEEHTTAASLAGNDDAQTRTTTAAIEQDHRFRALFTDSAFAIDRTHAQYKGGDLARRQVYEKVRKRQ